MLENGVYIIKNEYFIKFNEIGCKFKDCKEENRPVFCCLKDKVNEDLYWAIPLSLITAEKKNNGTMDRINKYINYKEGSLGWAFYHIGKTNYPAIFNISSVFPMTDKYIEREWILNEKSFVINETQNLTIIKSKLLRILGEERRRPNTFEQRITDIKNVLLQEINDSKNQDDVVFGKVIILDEIDKNTNYIEEKII